MNKKQIEKIKIYEKVNKTIFLNNHTKMFKNQMNKK